MPGCVYGVGVGPGDPELMTLKAVRILKAADVIACPGKTPEESTAYKIAVRAVPEIAGKERLSLSVPMTKDQSVLEKEHIETARRIEQLLDTGKDVACLTLGDPTIYSSFCYYQKILKKDGYRTEIISGVPSFCAVSAKLDIPLVEWQEQMHIIPAAQQKELNGNLSGTYVYMKTGKKLKELKAHLRKVGADVYMAENCGMENERICFGIEEIPDESSYYITVIAKETRSEYGSE